MIMNTRKSALKQIKIQSKAHTDLKQQKKPEHVINSRKCKTKDGRGWNNTEIKVDDEKKEDIKVETPECYDCQICGKQFKRKNSLKLHQMHHILEAKKDRYKCIGCNEGFKKVVDKREHELKCKKNESLSRLECCFCDLPCDTPKELRIHENKHRPIRKTKTRRNICVCIECEKTFNSIPSLKVHIQGNHKSHIQPEPSKNEEIISIKEENTSNTLTDVSNLTNQLHNERDHSKDSFEKKKPSSMQVPHVNNERNPDPDKPFMCLHCGFHYKYKNSKKIHELKYHGKSELRPAEDSQHCREESRSQDNETNQVFKKDESVDKFRRKEEETPKNGVNNDNNIIEKVKEEKCSLPLADHGLSVSDKKLNKPSERFRNWTIKKKCIGCDKAFDMPKERDEHELECGLNSFNRKFNCMFCDHPFSKPKALRKHENKHRPAKKTKRYRHRCVCIECNKTFDAIYTLRVHMQKLHRKSQVISHENKPFACIVCNARFKYEISKHKHEMRCHSDDLDRRTGHGVRDNVFTNVDVNNPGGLPEVCILESGGGDRVVEEPRGSLGCLTENTVVNSVFNIKTEVDVEVDSPLNSTSGIKKEEVEDAARASSPSRQRKRKRKVSVEGKRKKQKTGPFVCNNCEAKFNSPQGLWLHSYHQNMRMKRLSCIGCGKTFKSEKDTEEHELRCELNHNEYDFNCMFCDETFGNPKLLRNHEMKHRPRRRTKNRKCVCIDCRKPFGSIHSLKEHIRECHKNHVKVEEVCTQTDERRTLTVKDMKSCYVLLKDIGQVRAKKGKGKQKSCRARSGKSKIDEVASHVECKPGNSVTENSGDTAVVECATGVCGMSGCDEYTVEGIKRELDDVTEAPAYLVQSELANPEELMTGQETGSFHCGKCNSKFDSRGKLRYHSYSHRQRIKRQFCIGCGKGFEQSNDRERHELECDVNLTKRHFNCIFCELPFDTPQTLRNHEKKHRPPKRYKRYKHMCLCAECDRAFDAVFTLKIHIRHMHRGSKEKVKVKEEIEDVNFESDLTFEEYKFDGDLKVERFN